MLIALIVLAVLNLLMLGYIVFKMPERVEVENVFQIGDIASIEACRTAMAASDAHVARSYGAAWPKVKDCLDRMDAATKELQRIAALR